MFTIRRTLATLLIALCTLSPALAQDSNRAAPPAALTITAAAAAERVRFTAPSTVVKMHLEVYSEAGETLFDGHSKGNVFDWTLADGTGQRLANGSYLCVVTAKTLSGRISQRLGFVAVQDKEASVRGAQGTQLSAAQQQAVGPVEENSLLTVLGERETPAATVTAHDGQNGQVTSTTGALTFRTGDVFSGKEQEGMRLTTAGNLGIGTDNPEARLDVNGMIRARQGFQFADGSVLNLAPKGGLRITLPSGATMPVQVNSNAPMAPATQNYLPKFIDGGSSLGDSALSESNGFIGWGTTTPAHPFTVQRNGGSAGVHSFGELYVNRDSRNRSASMILGTGGQLKWIFGMPYQDDGFQIFDLLASPAPGVSRFYLHPTTGNIGIGTSTPTSRLHVLNTATQPGIYSESPNRGVWGKSTGSSYGVYGESVQGIGMQGVSTNNIGVVGATSAASNNVPGVYGVSGGNDGVGVLGEANNGIASGVFGRSTNAIGVRGDSAGATGFGVLATNPAGMALGVQGNATQNRDKGGLVKAMLYVTENGNMLRCFNSQLPDGGARFPPSGQTGCGFSINRYANGRYEITFPFQVSDRFVTVTPQAPSIQYPPDLTHNYGANFYFYTPNTINIYTFRVDEWDETRAEAFMLIIF